MLPSIVGIVTVVIGLLMISRPGAGLTSLTLFLAVYFLITGVFEIMWAFQVRPAKGWGWTLFTGFGLFAQFTWVGGRDARRQPFRWVYGAASRPTEWAAD